MAVRRGVSRAQWQARLMNACKEGKTFARKFDTAGAAWRACTEGRFLAWWLLEFYNVSVERLKSLLPRDADNRIIGHEWVLFNDTEAFANNLRAAFNVDGTRRATR